MRFQRPNFAAIGMAACCCITLIATRAQADVKIITIGDTVIPIDRDVTSLPSSYPANESPSKAIDNLYLPTTPTQTS